MPLSHGSVINHGATAMPLSHGSVINHGATAMPLSHGSVINHRSTAMPLSHGSVINHGAMAMPFSHGSVIRINCRNLYKRRISALLTTAQTICPATHFLVADGSNKIISTIN